MDNDLRFKCLCVATLFSNIEKKGWKVSTNVILEMTYEISIFYFFGFYTIFTSVYVLLLHLPRYLIKLFKRNLNTLCIGVSSLH